MTGEQYLLAGISAVTTALTFVTGGLIHFFRILWRKAERCDKDRYELRMKVEQLERDNGFAQGSLTAYEKCPDKTCPFRTSPVRYVRGEPVGETPKAQ